MENALITLRRVEKDYESGAGTVRALREVDLEIKQGEFVAVVGTCGSGKSTLRNILGCLDRPTRGVYELALTELSRDATTSSRSPRGSITEDQRSRA